MFGDEFNWGRGRKRQNAFEGMYFSSGNKRRRNFYMEKAGMF